VQWGRLPVLVLAVVVTSGCAEPFDETRQDLLSFRVAALGVVDGVATAAVWSGEGLFHTEAPTLDWTLNGQSIGSGWDVLVPGFGELGLRARSPDGAVREAAVTVAEPAPGALGVGRAAVDLTGDLALEGRREVVGEDIDTTVDLDEATRLTVSGRTDGERLRWMLGGGVGTLLELDEDRADLLAETVEFEDGEVILREPLTEEVLHTLVLAVDDAGGNRWLWADAAFVTSQTLLRHEGRLLPVTGTVAPGWVAVTLSASGEAGGVALADATPVTDLSEQQGLSCAPTDGPFRLAWLAEGRCPLPDLDGARIVVEAW